MIAKAGGDPRQANGKAVMAPTLAEAAEAVIAIHEPTWRSPKSGPQWRASLETYAYPSIGDLPVSEITPGHVMAVLGKRRALMSRGRSVSTVERGVWLG